MGRGFTLAALVLLVTAACSTERPSEDPGLVAFTNVTVIDGSGTPPVPGRTVLVRDGVIEAVGASADVDPFPGATVVDGGGRWLVPGLIDMHVHLSKVRGSALPLFVVHGVTTLRDAGSEWEEILAWRDAIRSGARIGPRIRSAGPYLETAENVDRMRAARSRGEMVEPVERTRIPVDSPERARHVVDSVADLGVDLIKFRTVASLDVYRAILRTAHARDLPAAGHTFGIPLATVVREGQESIEHFVFPLMDDVPEAERRALYREMADSGTIIVPTLVTWTHATLAPDSILAAQLADSAGARWPERRFVSRYLELDWREQMSERGGEAPVDWDTVHASTLRTLREMHEEGVQVLPGTDPAVLGIYPGAALHDELELLVDQVGMTPLEALTSATSRSADWLGLADSVGTISPGLQADLLLLSADPTQDIANTRRIEAVMTRGRLLRAAALDSLRAEVLEHEALRRNDWSGDDPPPSGPGDGGG